MSRSVVLLALVVGLVGCGGETTPPPTATPVPIVVHETAVIPPTITSTLTLSPTYAPTYTPTPTATSTATATINWSATPTMITPGAIVEVTPLGGFITPTPQRGSYTVWTKQNVRNGPGIEYDVVSQVYAGNVLVVTDWMSELPDEAWVCISLGCTKWVAAVYDGELLGKLVLE